MTDPGLNQAGNQDRQRLRDRYYGVYIGLIEDTDDPKILGRVKVRVSAVNTDKSKIPTSALPWAHFISLGGGGTDHGDYRVPPVGSQVAVMYMQGDPHHPFWMGTVWGKDDTITEVGQRAADTTGQSRHAGNVYPGSNIDGATAEARKVSAIRTPGGHKIIFDDNSGGDSQHVTLETAGGHIISFDDKAATRRLEMQTPLGHNILMSDISGKESIVITTKGGQEIWLDDETPKIEINTDDGHQLSMNSSTDIVELSTNGGHTLKMTESGKILLSSTGDLDLTASGDVNITGTNINLN